MRSFYFLALGISLIGCQPTAQEPSSKSTPIPRGENNSSSPAESQDQDSQTAENSIDGPRESTSSRRFYPVDTDIDRPAEVCGLAGFTYLTTVYFTEECGGCHYEGNRFGVTAFAIRGDLEASYQVMLSQVNPELLVEASIENAFCNSCLLRDDDPLLADISYFAEHRADSQCENP